VKQVYSKHVEPYNISYKTCAYIKAHVLMVSLHSMVSLNGLCYKGISVNIVQKLMPGFIEDIS